MNGVCPIGPMKGWGLQKPPLGVSIDRGHPLARGLVCCLPLNEGAGLKATDAAGKREFDAIYTHLWTPTPYGMAFQGDTGSLVSNWKPPAYPNGLTVSLLWCRNGSADHTYFGDKRYSGMSGFTLLARKAGWDYWTPRVGNGLAQDGVDLTSIPITDGQWQRVTFVFDCSGAVITVAGYRNGLLAQSATSTGVAPPIGAGEWPLRLGIDGQYDGYRMDSVLADWFMWDRVLSASDVHQHHAQPYCMFGGCP